MKTLSSPAGIKVSKVSRRGSCFTCLRENPTLRFSLEGGNGEIIEGKIGKCEEGADLSNLMTFTCRLSPTEITSPGEDIKSQEISDSWMRPIIPCTLGVYVRRSGWKTWD